MIYIIFWKMIWSGKLCLSLWWFWSLILTIFVLWSDLGNDLDHINNDHTHLWLYELRVLSRRALGRHGANKVGIGSDVYHNDDLTSPSLQSPRTAGEIRDGDKCTSMLRQGKEGKWGAGRWTNDVKSWTWYVIDSFDLLTCWRGDWISVLRSEADSGARRRPMTAGAARQASTAKAQSTTKQPLKCRPEMPILKKMIPSIWKGR